jgi:iron-sulfur cluster repair protein YtfE (RIC family)
MPVFMQNGRIPGSLVAAKFIQTDATVEQVLLEYPATAAVFNSFGIDLCCGGGASLSAAAEHEGIDLRDLLGALERAASSDRQDRSR